MADLVEIAAVKVKGNAIVDRWSTFVDPGRPIVGNQMHGITNDDIRGAPSPAEAARKALDFAGDAMIVGHSVGFDIAFIEAALGDGTKIEPGRYLDTLVIAREGYPDLENYKLPTLSNFFGVDLTQSHRALPDAGGDRQPAAVVRMTCRARLSACEASPTPSAPTGPAATPMRSSSRRVATPASARACSASSRRRPCAGSSSTRGSGSTGVLTDIRPISVEVGLITRTWLRPVHPW